MIWNVRFVGCDGVGRCVPEGIEMPALIDAHNDEVTMLVVEGEFRIEVVGVRRIAAVAARERLPKVPQTIQVGVMSEKDRIRSRVFKPFHVVLIHPPMNRPVGNSLYRSLPAAASIPIPIRRTQKHAWRASQTHNIHVHQMSVRRPHLRRVTIQWRTRRRVLKLQESRQVVRAARAIGIIQRRQSLVDVLLNQASV